MSAGDGEAPPVERRPPGTAWAPTRRALLTSTAAALGGSALVVGVTGCSPAGTPPHPPTTTAPATPSSVSPSPAAPTTPITPTTPSAPNWRALADRLTGRVLRPGDDGYEVSRLAANPRFDGVRPTAVARCATTADVAATIRWAREAGVPFTVRSGGHSYGGWSTGPDLVLDLSALTAVGVDPGSGTVTVAAGCRLVDVYRRVAAAGVGIPAGSCPSVGVSGLTLGGGIGVLARAWGLTCDTLTGYRLVDAAGQVRRVDERSDPDLFWAGRGGGGGSFGVVTSFDLGVRPAPDLTLFALRWPWAAAATVADAWQHWAPVADSRLWSTCKLLTTPRAARVLVAGAWAGPAQGLDGALRGLLSGAGSATTYRSARRHPYLEAMLVEAGCSADPTCHLPPTGTLAREFEAATSQMPTGLAPAVAWGTLVGAVERMAAEPGLTEAGVSMDALGGAVGEVGAADTAFVHRASPFSVQYTATWTGARDPARFDRLVRSARAAMAPHFGSGAYVNYPDAELAGWPDAYWGAGYGRLQQVKRRVDPQDVFRFAQSVRL